MKWFFPTKLDTSKWQDFYQTKYQYHAKAFRWIVILMCLAEVSYFVSDCQTFGYINWKMLLPRTAILVPLILFLFFNKYHKGYIANIFFGYFLMHACMWCTIWAIYYLENRDYAREGFIVMHFGFLALGLAAPYYLSSILHAFIFLNIIVSNQFIHYEQYEMMLSLAVPLYLGIILFQKILENNYVDHYIDHKKLEALSTHDQLTQAYNRNILADLLIPGTTQLRKEFSQDTWFLLLDVDFFKKVNDTYGHEAGDIILTTIADCIHASIRKNDFCLRWGGEEFVIILQNITRMEAITIAERIRASIEQSDTTPAVTISVGVSQYQGADYHQAINDADAAMYKAKHSGRNRVVCYND